MQVGHPRLMDAHRQQSLLSGLGQQSHNFKWCFINKVREEHVQIIKQSINQLIKQLPCLPYQHERKHIYIHSVNSPNFLDSFSIPLPPRLLTLGLFFHSQEYGGSTLGSGRIPSPEPSPRTARQIRIYSIWLICKCELVKWCFINKVREEHVQIIK